MIAAISSAKTMAKPALRADLQDQFDRQQRDDAEGDRAGRNQHAEKIEAARPDHRDRRRQGMRVDHGRDRIGGIVEAVDELEAQRDHEREAEQDEGQHGGDRGPGRRDVAINAERREEQAQRDDDEKDQKRERRHWLVEIGLRAYARSRQDVWRG